MDTDTSKGKTIEERLNDFHSPAPIKADAVKQPEAMPAPEQKPAEPLKVEEAPKEEAQPSVAVETAEPKVEQPVDEEAEALANSKNPERTKAYIEKLKAKLRDKEETVKAPPIPEENYGSVFDVFHPQQPVAPQVQQQPVQYLNQNQVQSIRQNYIAPDGTVDIEGLNKALYQAEQRALQAEQRVRANEERVQRFEENQQVRETYAVHPELDPLRKESFNPSFWKAVRDRKVSDFAYGKNRSLLEIANEIKREIGGMMPKVDVKQVEAQVMKKTEEVKQARNQGPFESGRGDAKGTTESYDQLRARTRKKGAEGDRALSERLKRAGIL
jgi:hypothetical protein